jgi:hypothetical protein
MTHTVTEYFHLTKETIVREATSDEVAQQEIDNAAELVRIATIEAKAEAKAAAQAKLAALGLTVSDLEALGL